MGPEFQLGRWAILFDFDNEAEHVLNSGLDLVRKLDMNQHGALKQLTPTRAATCPATQLTAQPIRESSMPNLKNQICNCAPGEIEGYRRHGSESATRLGAYLF